MAVAVAAVAGASGSLGADPVIDISGMGIQDGDTLVAFGIATGAATITAHANWTTHPNSISTTAPLWTRIASSEPSSYTFTVSGTANAIILIVRITGAASIDAAAGVSGSGNLTIASVTSAGANRNLVQVAAKNQASITWSTPGGATVFSDTTYPSQSYAGVVAEQAVGAGATGTRQWNPSAGTQPGVAYMLAIAPPAAGGNPGAGFLGIL